MKLSSRNTQARSSWRVSEDLSRTTSISLIDNQLLFLRDNGPKSMPETLALMFPSHLTWPLDNNYFMHTHTCFASLLSAGYTLLDAIRIPLMIDGWFSPKATLRSHDYKHARTLTTSSCIDVIRGYYCVISCQSRSLCCIIIALFHHSGVRVFFLEVWRLASALLCYLWRLVSYEMSERKDLH